MDYFYRHVFFALLSPIYKQGSFFVHHQSRRFFIIPKPAKNYFLVFKVVAVSKLNLPCLVS